MPVADFVKEIQAKKLKAVQDRLKKEKASQKYIADAKLPNVFHTLLHVAVKAGDPAIVEALLAAAADVTAVDHEDSTPLHWASRSDATVKIAEALLKKKAKVDAVNKAKQTPLHAAAAAGALAAMDLLLKAGAAADLAPAGGVTPLQGAVRGCCEGSLKASAMLAVVDRLTAAGAKLSARDAGGLTPLMRLVEAGRVAEALQLMERPGCGLDELDTSGRSVLMAQVAAEQPHLDLVKGLVERGASADLLYPQCLDTPLHVAARRGSLPLVAALLPAVKKPYSRNAAKATAVEVALAEAPAGGGGAAVAEAIVAAAGDPGEAGLAVMRAAVEKKADGVAALLVPLLKPAALTSLDLDFKKLVAAGLGKAAMAYLKRFDSDHGGGAPVDDAGNTHLHLVAESGAAYDVVAAMMSLGLSPNAANKEGDSPLHVAARAGHVEVCRALVEGGADVLKRNNKNRTPRSQLKLPESTKGYLGEAEEAAKAAKEAKKSSLWDDKMKATQTESAFGVRVM